MSSLLDKIESKNAHVVVQGIGYVGLPMVAELSRAGYRVTGLDHDAQKARLLEAGQSYIQDVPSEDLAPHAKEGRLRGTTDPKVLREADAVIVCVPTPLNKTKDPDMRFIVEATEAIAAHQHAGMLVVLESTTYPGTTTEVMVPKLTANGFRLGRDVFVAFSPERVDPGNSVYKTKNTPKVIGGATPECSAMVQALYSKIIDTLVVVSSTEAAEMVKLLENTFRAVNIGLVNEIAIMSRRLGIDPFEVIRAAASKPFGYMPFYPGPGLGGHCIPIDPLYLSWKLRALKYQARFIELADSINSAMPEYVVERVAAALNDHAKPLRGSNVLVYGIAYKKDVNDVRESPAFDVIEGLKGRGAKVSYMDPHVPQVSEHGLVMTSVGPSASFEPYDAVVVVTDHTGLPRERLLAEAKLVVDTRDALHGVPGDRSRVVGL
ncbi:MAG: nucleotide sugar dehydrogenase [Myxococcales bacterium]|nr:nucleotide sugar dehydrogenase [Myxococcales bacterium]MCB9583130.1 nucleotide sugar dehydrogenase [Polyangiaceae bacterium]